jgi:hypothetical protein
MLYQVFLHCLNFFLVTLPIFKDALYLIFYYLSDVVTTKLLFEIGETSSPLYPVPNSLLGFREGVLLGSDYTSPVLKKLVCRFVWKENAVSKGSENLEVVLRRFSVYPIQVQKDISVNAKCGFIPQSL